MKPVTVSQTTVNTAHLSTEDKAKLAEQLLLEIASELKPEQEYKRYFALQAVAEIRKLGYNEPPKWVKPAKRK